METLEGQVVEEIVAEGRIDALSDTQGLVTAVDIYGKLECEPPYHTGIVEEMSKFLALLEDT